MHTPTPSISCRSPTKSIMPPPHQSDTSTGDSAANQLSAVIPYPNQPAAALSAAAVHPVTLKFEEVVYKVKVGHESGGGWVEMMSSFCGGNNNNNGGKSSGSNRWFSSPAAARPASEKTILNGISGMVCPGEMLAMLGPSGSGKTTLLSALGGRLQPTGGKISYNGQPFSRCVKRRTGFVAQDDVLYPHLTVSETLTFTALLRLPRTLSRAEKAQQAQQVMAELGLGRVAHTMIGGPLFRGVSGGERKRVSIGLEMLVNPSLLLLDEPTSGLDSTTAQRILTTLKRLAAEGGRTVVTTIHQPSTRLYHMFDKLLLLSQGFPIYYGRGSAALDYFSSIGFFVSSNRVAVNPADVLLDLANGIALDSRRTPSTMELQLQGDVEDEGRLVREELISAYDRNIATRLKAELYSTSTVDTFDCKRASDAPYSRRREQWSTSWCEQFRVLLRRSLKERRYEAFNKLRIFQVLSVATLGGLLWWHTNPNHIADKTALIFFFSVFWGFFPLYNAVFTFPQERSMLIKERSSGMYRLSSYFLARTAGDLPMELALPTAFVFIIYWMGGLKPDPFSFLLSLLVVLYNVLVSQSLGLAIGAILMDVKQATTLASVTTLVFLIAGGYYVQHIPPFILWLKYLSYSFYCYKLLLGVQFSDADVYDCSASPSAPPVMCRVRDFPPIKSVGLNHLWMDVCIMAFMLVGYRLIAFMALHRLRPR